MGNHNRDKIATLNWMLKVFINQAKKNGIEYKNENYFIKSFYEIMIWQTYDENIVINKWVEMDDSREWYIRNEDLLKEIVGEERETLKLEESYFKDCGRKMKILPIIAGVLFFSEGLNCEESEAVDAAVEYFYKLKPDSKENDKVNFNLEQIEKLEKFIKFTDGYLEKIEKLTVKANIEIEAFRRMCSSKKREINENNFEKEIVENSEKKNRGEEINGKD